MTNRNTDNSAPQALCGVALCTQPLPSDISTVPLPCSDSKVWLTVSQVLGDRRAAAVVLVTQSPEDTETWGAPYLRRLRLMNVQWEITSPSLSLCSTCSSQAGTGILLASVNTIRCWGHLPPCGRPHLPPSCQAPCVWYYRGHTQPVPGCRLEYLKAIQGLKFKMPLSSQWRQQVSFSLTALSF